MPDESEVNICSSKSEIIVTEELGAVFPVTVVLPVVFSDSSSGEVRVKVRLETGVGEGEVPEGWAELLAESFAVGDEATCLRLLFAVQIPKVMTSPKANPMAMAKTTSFFMFGLEINNRNWYCQANGNYVFWPCLLSIEG